MTWVEFAGARQLLAEEQVGLLLRTYQKIEDRQVKATQDALRRQDGPR